MNRDVIASRKIRNEKRSRLRWIHFWK